MQESQKLFTRPLFLVSLVCTVLVWLFFMWVVRPFVPDQEPAVSWVLAAYTAVPLAGVFFLSFHSLAVILVDPLRKQRP